ncbi:uncharacterized protein CLUP02_11876 [Colletotrichum lupini]|uniref:Uncharacterized protein n=1 Tax=Colletotrichum lupini TaxID=145971 RepID=A0A9Q8WK90_9PEZI|nr:uncharacterized protein CLUP02_11876 [Colletotrichum lupini]UQC86376.1 hypothetical protein CLUP02_11876 [Colletotrichum lupini]
MFAQSFLSTYSPDDETKQMEPRVSRSLTSSFQPQLQAHIFDKGKEKVQVDFTIFDKPGLEKTHLYSQFEWSIKMDTFPSPNLTRNKIREPAGTLPSYIYQTYTSPAANPMMSRPLTTAADTKKQRATKAKTEKQPTPKPQIYPEPSHPKPPSSPCVSPQTNNPGLHTKYRRETPSRFFPAFSSTPARPGFLHLIRGFELQPETEAVQNRYMLAERRTGVRMRHPHQSAPGSSN